MNKFFSNEKGSVTIYVLAAMLFMLIFLVVLFVNKANEVNAGIERLNQIQAEYNSSNIDDIYNNSNVERGTLVIHSKVMSYANITKNVNLGYRVTATKNGDEIYNKIVTTTHKTAGEQTITLEDVPANADILVQSLYTLGSYNLTSNQEQSTTVSKEATTDVTFTYEYNNKNISSSSEGTVLSYNS